MSARIAPEPVSTAPAAVAEYRPRSLVGDQVAPVESGGGASTNTEPGERFADLLPPLPLPPDPPGVMFAAAVAAGALSPKPETPEEIFLRIGKEWSPPESELHLADRTA
jgi:hypothetical protein